MTELPSLTADQVGTLVHGYFLYRKSHDNLDLVKRGFLERLPHRDNNPQLFQLTASGAVLSMRLRDTFAEGTT